LLAALSVAVQPAKEKPGVVAASPLSPRDALASFHVPKGFKVELAASEPDIVDPVAMAFDENGRMFVVEMRAYPNDGVGTGVITSGRIVMLEDKTGDGFFERTSVYADNLRLPTSVMPYKGGLLVCNAPDIIYLEDTKGTGKADKKRVLYTGFNLANIQQMVNSLQWGLDNWVYGCAGSNGGTVTSAEDKKAPAVTLRARGIRFKPDVPASLEPTSGGGQFGLTFDDWGNWFTATNSQHLRHIVLPDHYLRRNPLLPVSQTTIDIPDHGAACKVHRISPFEKWREERTKMRKDGPDSKRFPPTELFPGGFITSACSPIVYLADRFPQKYYGNIFVCDPANNLIHRDILVPKGATFVAQRGDADCDFFASTDTWCRPVNLTIGPDGAIYVCDFYREVIETPLSLPDDIKKRYNLNSRGRGRIWRIVPDDGKKAVRPALGKAKSADLVPHLANPNMWWRMTAQRLLVERQDLSVKGKLGELAEKAKFAPGRSHALWTLQGLGALTKYDVAGGLRDPSPIVRAQALRMAEPLIDAAIIKLFAGPLAEDPSPRVRFQLALTLGQANDISVGTALLKIAREDGDDPWTRTALLTSSAKVAPVMLHHLSRDTNALKQTTPAEHQLIKGQVMLVVSAGEDFGIKSALDALETALKAKASPLQTAILEGLANGARNRGQSIGRVWHGKSLDFDYPEIHKMFRDAERTLAESGKLEQRLAAMQILTCGPSERVGYVMPRLLTPQEPRELQIAAVRALSAHDVSYVAPILIKPWAGYSPEVRSEVLDALLAHKDRASVLLAAIVKKKILASQLGPARIAQLRKFPDAKIRAQAAKVLAGQVAPAREKVLKEYQTVFDLKGDSKRGKLHFKRVCSVCHRLENEGNEVGADLQSILRQKAPDALLVDILDPNREVDPRFIEYVATMKDGRVVNGLIAAETAASVTLRKAEGKEETLLRTQIESFEGTAKSLMPEGLEMQINRQEMADLLAYLRAVGAKK
jgi:putative membrane-bound dehydrogenase-like protein